MARLHFVKKARNNIYATGKRIKASNKRGYRYDTSQPADKEDTLIVKKGESYYWWQFAFRSKQISKERPARSRYATQSEHLGAIYDIEDEINAMTVNDVEEGCLDDFISRIEEIIDTCQERLDNIPEQLKEASAGETLQSYIDNCEDWKSQLEDIDFSDLDDDFQTDAENEIDEDDFKDDEGELDEAAYQSAITEKAEELEQDTKEAILSDIQGCSYPG